MVMYSTMSQNKPTLKNRYFMLDACYGQSPNTQLGELPFLVHTLQLYKLLINCNAAIIIVSVECSKN